MNRKSIKRQFYARSAMYLCNRCSLPQTGLPLVLKTFNATRDHFACPDCGGELGKRVYPKDLIFNQKKEMKLAKLIKNIDRLSIRAEGGQA